MCGKLEVYKQRVPETYSSSLGITIHYQFFDIPHIKKIIELLEKEYDIEVIE